jgi:uncharacterized protein YdeI (YjbR/CyaY-like superfamily)
MKEVYLPTRAKWRKWLSDNHDKEKNGIWLVFYKKETGKPSLEYEESVEEALCFGWIDSIIKKIDDEKYYRKFTPRKLDSKWSELNKKRVKKVIKEGRMTEYGLAKIEAAKKSGLWEGNPPATINLDIPKELVGALRKNKKAKGFFDQLAPTYQKHYIAWITTARRPETKEKRIKESITLLEQGKKLGLK